MTVADRYRLDTRMRFSGTINHAAALMVICCSGIRAQTACATGMATAVIVRDPTGAAIPGASVTVDSGPSGLTGTDGRYRTPCLQNGRHTLRVTANAFADQAVNFTVPGRADLSVTLRLSTVTTSINVSGDDTTLTGESSTAAGPTQTITGSQLAMLADDPDDLLRELQQLSAASGGAPANATIAVDGFDNGEGSTQLPPKSSIAYIRVNPDLFSAEYRNPPLSGGRVEIYTKPGQSVFHGALFLTNSSSWMNARDPFSTANVSLGKQRYGFELSGPILRKTSDFFLSLEHRDISNDAVVNAIGVNAAGIERPILDTVTAPQHLWNGLAKTDWQCGPKNTFIASFSSARNDQPNFGVGGTALPETGAERRGYGDSLHLSLVTIISPHIMHEARIGLERDGTTYTPTSTAPSVSVAGAFTAGGSPTGATQQRERYVEIIDDVVIQTKRHLLKAGLLSELSQIESYAQTNFNGVYTFGGMTTASGQTVTGVQQYVNALNAAPNGSPTEFSNTTGSPYLQVSQIRNSLFIQDDWKVRPNLHVALGIRYYAQDHPAFSGELQPRLGISWSPDKAATWELHAHAGTFAGRFGVHNWNQIQLANGTDRSRNLVYSPLCPGAFDPNTCQPLSSGTVLHSLITVAPDLKDTHWGSENVGFTKRLGKGLSFTSDYYLWQMWDYERTENINPPINGQPTGPRPYGPNMNILQVQSTGRGYGNVEFFALTGKSKYLQFYAGATRSDLIDDTDDNVFFTPMTTGVNSGEYARRDSQGLWQVFGNTTVHLPKKVEFSAIYNLNGMQPYNITTGFDNNGDGDFNDRPQYAPAGTPLCSTNRNASPCGYATPWGELVNSGGTQYLPRNKGNMPWTVYLDINLQRAFVLVKDRNAKHQQVLLVNIRSSNVLNHENVTSVGTVLGSPLFGRPYAAAPGRRVEMGVRYSF